MSTPTILRVKRRKNQDPSEVLVLSAKKRKADDTIEAEDNIKILKLAATVDVKDDPAKLTQTVNKILAKKNAPNFEELKQRYKKSLSVKNSPMHQAKLATEESRQESRFKLVAQKRALKIEDLEEWPENENSDKPEVDSNDKESKELYRLYDVVSEDTEKKPVEKESDKISCNGVEMIREFVDAKKDCSAESEYGYVYDVYYTQGCDGDTDYKDFDDSLLDGLVSIQPFNTGDSLVYDEYRDDPDEFKYEDDEDSNDEDNERNEYPDEDDEESSYKGYCDDGDIDLDMRVKGLGICQEDGSDLSSDDEDQLLYTRAFDEDAAHHGSAYARFKQRMVKEFYGDEDDDDEDGSEDDE
eukprot:GFUD01030091.1.p1 GENE.GFUD01030091.1~~GFUD01030091.1.p1  ORF type:complete len:355 (-),score=120.56 GFUD01030091.1:119-1183(-)